MQQELHGSLQLELQGKLRVDATGRASLLRVGATSFRSSLVEGLLPTEQRYTV